jgi:sec-independent protein translocase protein TatA
MFNSIGLPELAIVLVIVLLIFGPKRLPGLGKALGGGMRDFKDAITGKDRGDDDGSGESEKPAALESAPEVRAESKPEPERVTEPR